MEKSTKAYKTFNGKKYTLYKSGTKQQVNNYILLYGIPKKAKYRIIKDGATFYLYMIFAK